MIRINEKRLWQRQQQIASIGADKRGGISRFAWTSEYREACQLLNSWMEQANLTVRMDSVGNLFGRMDGAEQLPAILSGSHFDTVPQGGKYDGITGIMATLEVLQTLRDYAVVPRRPIELVAIINEEASQFLGGTFGSKAMCGMLPHDYPYICRHRATGQTLRDAMLKFDMNLDPDNIESSILRRDDYCCFLEVHIEQGRYLLDHDLPLAVVSDIAGIKQFYISIHGVSCHAGGMAMNYRHDALAAAAEITCEVERLAKKMSPHTRGTVGFIQTVPAEHNIVAGEARMPVDYREADDDKWLLFYSELMAHTEKACKSRGLTYSVCTTLDERPAHCHLGIQHQILGAADAYGIQHTEMISYPCHDAMNMARIMPTGMIFLRSSNNGVSHCPEEYTTPEDLACGANTLLGTILNICDNDF